ncbi:hypothetical protein [Actinacidiphila alni]|uniref:hypothetical protein n=1 Tax=Actinacidiphila alni TaxID=380248 RepID=UPI00345136A0
MALAISLLAILIAVGALAHNGLEGRRHHVRQIEEFYLTRYWRLLDDLPSDALICGDSSGQETADQKAAYVRSARLYLRLCEDELEIRERGMVSDDTWDDWVKGMNNQLDRWPVSIEWQNIRDGALKQQTRKQFKHLRQVEGSVKLYDPCKWKRRSMRWYHGL